MIKPISATSYAQAHTSTQRTSQKTPSFGRMTYFIEGTKPVVCSHKKEASLLKRFLNTLKSNLLYNQGPESYKRGNTDAATHTLTNSKGSHLFVLDENHEEKGRHVFDINPGINRTNTTVFIYEDAENKPLLEKISKHLEKLRGRDDTFTRG